MKALVASLWLLSAPLAGQQLEIRFLDVGQGVPHTTATYRRTIEAVQASGAQYLRPTARTITLGDASIQILAPPSGEDQNNASVGVLIEYGEFHALFTGDSELRELNYWLGGGSAARAAPSDD